MSAQVLVGPVLDALGLAQSRYLIPGRDHPEVRTRTWSTPATELRSVQPATIPLNFAHERGTRFGEVVWLERDKAGRCWAVGCGDLDGNLRDGLYYSAETDSDPDGRDVVLTGVGIVERTAQLGLFPIVALPGRLDDFRSRDSRRGLPPVAATVLEHAAHQARRRDGDPLVIYGDTPAGASTFGMPPAGRMEFRTAEHLDVRPSRRTIELVVMPYERETVVAHEGRMVREVCSRGAFDGVDRQGNKVRVNRDHKVERTVGQAVRFDTRRPDGLVAELQIARTALGDETIALADEGILDASAGFLPYPDGERWETRSRRRLSRCWLDHVALTPDPAYADARVLAVRDRMLSTAG